MADDIKTMLEKKLDQWTEYFTGGSKKDPTVTPTGNSSASTNVSGRTPYQIPGRLLTEEDAPAATPDIHGKQLDEVDANANGLDPYTTRRYSRLADRINNRVWYDPVLGNAGTAGRFVSYEGAPVTGGQPYKMPKIETEEMRQQAMNRELAKLKAQEKIIRSGKLFGQDLERAMAKYNTMLQQFHLQYGVMAQQYSMRFQEDLKTEVAQIRAKLASDPSIYGQILARLFGTMGLSPVTAMWQKSMYDIYSTASSPQAGLLSVLNMATQMTAQGAGEVFNGASSILNQYGLAMPTLPQTQGTYNQ